MAYTPPNNDAVDFVVIDGYSAPAHDGVNFAVGGVSTTTQLANDTLDISSSSLNLFGMVQIAVSEAINLADSKLYFLYMYRQINETLGISDGILRIGVMFRLMADSMGITEIVYKSYGITKLFSESLGISELLISFWKSTRIFGETIIINETSESIFEVIFRVLRKFVGYSDEAFYHVSEIRNKFYNKLNEFIKFFTRGE